MFTDTQLTTVKVIARKKKNQGELSVYKEIYGMYGEIDRGMGWTTERLNILKYCAEECKRQVSGTMSVYDMLFAWTFAMDFVAIATEHNEFCADVLHFHGFPNLTMEFIEHIGTLVEPIDNKKGFRTIPIGIGNGLMWIEKAKYWDIERLLEHLLASYYAGDLEANHEAAKDAIDEFYYQYEEIHPFRDGNGRSGKILYNYLRGTLNNPVMPPMFWKNGVP